MTDEREKKTPQLVVSERPDADPILPLHLSSALVLVLALSLPLTQRGRPVIPLTLALPQAQG